MELNRINEYLESWLAWSRPLGSGFSTFRFFGNWRQERDISASL